MPHSRTSGRPRVCSRTPPLACSRRSAATTRPPLTRCSTRALLRSAWRRSLRQVVLPTLKQVGDGWERGEIEISEEHFASNLIRGRLLALARFWGRGTGPLALLACAPGEMHDITLLAFALVLRSHALAHPLSRRGHADRDARPRGRDDQAGARRRLELRPRPARGAGRRRSAGWPGGAARARRPRRNGRALRPSRRAPPGRGSRCGSRRGRAGMTFAPVLTGAVRCLVQKLPEGS